MYLWIPLRKCIELKYETLIPRSKEQVPIGKWINRQSLKRVGHPIAWIWIRKFHKNLLVSKFTFDNKKWTLSLLAKRVVKSSRFPKQRISWDEFHGQALKHCEPMPNIISTMSGHVRDQLHFYHSLVFHRVIIIRCSKWFIIYPFNAYKLTITSH